MKLSILPFAKLTFAATLAVCLGAQNALGAKSEGATQSAKNTAAPKPLPEAPDDRGTLAAIFDKARRDLAGLEALIRSNDYETALARAKESLDEVRLKSGIHPKASYREKIQLPPGSLTDSFRNIGMPYKRLSIDAQDAVALAVANHRAGYFLDLLNLMKRTNLIYIKAFHQTLKRRGNLLQRDIDKIKQDIMAMHAIPLYVKDAKIETYFLVFDFEVAQSDQNYLFNRELMDYLLAEGKDLSIRSENDVETMLNAAVQRIRNEYFASSTGQPIETSTEGSTNIFKTASYRACYSKYSSSLHDHQAADRCLALVPRHNFMSESFESCYQLNAGSLHAHQAADKCLQFAK